ncbi:hypothetical protein GCM10020001_110400 [Nonomuraea salmonea]
MSQQHTAPGLRAWLGLTVVLGPVLLVSMDGSILFLAMPRISQALLPTADQALWILDGYGFAVGSLLIASGNLGDRYGRLKLLMIGATVFGIGSALAAYAPNAELLIAARALMGVAGATLLPSALAVLSELFADPRRRAQAIGVFAAAFAAGFAIGPVVGGLALERFWWGSVFLVNVPVVALFLLLAPGLLREVRTKRAGRIDALSVVTSALGLLLVIYAVKAAATEGLSGSTMIAGVAGAALLAWFARRQLSLRQPLMDFSLFRDRLFSLAIVTGLLPLAAWSATAYLAGVYLQSVLGLSVLHAALLAIPGAVVLTITCVVTPSVVDRIGKRTALIACHFSIAGGLLFLLPTAITGGIGWYVTATVVTGIGYGISFSVVADTAVGAVPVERAGAAGAIAETSNELGNALGIALLGSLAALVFRLQGPDLAPPPSTRRSTCATWRPPWPRRRRRPSSPASTWSPRWRALCTSCSASWPSLPEEVAVGPAPGQSLPQVVEVAAGDPADLRLVPGAGQPANLLDPVLLNGDDRVGQALGRGQAVGGGEELQAVAPVGGLGTAEPAQAFGVVAERRDVLQRVGDIVQPGPGPGVVPVQDPHGPFASPDDVPRAEVAVADHLVVARVRREPAHAVGQAEARDRVVVVAEEAGEGGQARVAGDLGPALRAGLAVQVGEDLAALAVDSQHPRGVREAHVLQVPEQGVDGGRPRVGGPADGVPDAYDPAMGRVLQDLHGFRP